MATPAGITTTQSIVLDLVRFLCSQGVVLGHLGFFFGVQNLFLHGISSYCVLMFFVLSGFLISLSLYSNIRNNPGYGFRDFFLDRFFRIYPPFMAALLLVLVLDVISFAHNGIAFPYKVYGLNFVINSLQLQEYPVANMLSDWMGMEAFRFRYFGTDLPLWTISIEWWLYMFFGFLVFYIVRNPQRRIHQYLILLFFSITPVYYLFVTRRMDNGLTLFWFLGVVITLLCMKKERMLMSTPLILTSLLLMAAGMLGFSEIGYYPSITLFFTALMAFIAYGGKEFHGFNNVIRNISHTLAGYSYSLYLVHYTIIYFVFIVFQPEQTISNFLFLFLAVNAVAYLFALVFEKNQRKFRKLYENYRSVDHRL